MLVGGTGVKGGAGFTGAALCVAEGSGSGA
jgi:hypothetical protein